MRVFQNRSGILRKLDSAIDADGDGWHDATAATALPINNLDGDTAPNHLDLDSDNDGIPDVIEVGGSDTDGDAQVDGFTDADDDGLHDSSAGTFGPDTDSDTIHDVHDLDSDNDGITDASESSGNDTDGDGIIDGFTDIDGDGFDDTTASAPVVPANSDGDSAPDHLDLDSDNDGPVSYTHLTLPTTPYV